MILHFIKSVMLIMQTLNVSINCELKLGFLLDVEHIVMKFIFQVAYAKCVMD